MSISVLSSVLWHNPEDKSAEVCRLVESRDGFVFEGVVLLPADGVPCRVEYRVEADFGWRTRRADVRMECGSSEKGLSVTHEESGWLLNGEHQEQLDACTDVDLRFTPATNTLPIHRLSPAVGETVEVRAAWVGFPDLKATPSTQSYERLSETTYRFRSGDFVADLVVDDVGLVLRYGDDFWTMLAHAAAP
ncbi:MAG: putative glycolipid-binding domain-containing protein [Actinomycetota bacterium]